MASKVETSSRPEGRLTNSEGEREIEVPECQLRKRGVSDACRVDYNEIAVHTGTPPRPTDQSYHY
jgi:hypothetical protein